MVKKSKSIIKSLAIVLPRNGDAIGGGAETLVKALVEQLYLGDEMRRVVAEINKGPIGGNKVVDRRAASSI